jgi:hypothetical protein
MVLKTTLCRHIASRHTQPSPLLRGYIINRYLGIEASA